MESDSESIRHSGWKQGSLVRQGDVETLIGAAVDQIGTLDLTRDRTGLIVVSQDCDLVRDSVAEPFVELIAIKKNRESKPQYFNGRNPRLLQIPVMKSQGGTSIQEISIHDRFRVEKKWLRDLAPDENKWLEERYRKLLCGWIAKRYDRPAFPDAFNQRLEPVERRLETLFKSKISHHVSGIYIAGADQEHTAEDSYLISVRVTYEERWSEDFEVLDSVENFLQRLSDILEGCQGIDLFLGDIRKTSEEDLTLGELREFRRFDRDYRSLPEEEGKAIPVKA